MTGLLDFCAFSRDVIAQRYCELIYKEKTWKKTLQPFATILNWSGAMDRPWIDREKKGKYREVFVNDHF